MTVMLTVYVKELSSLDVGTDKVDGFHLSLLGREIKGNGKTLWQ